MAKPLMNKVKLLAKVVLISAAAGSLAFAQVPSQPAGYAGSRSCAECHERFYQLWSNSFHGLAMQPYSQALASAKLTEQKGGLTIGKYQYRAEISGPEGWVMETGPEGENRYKIEHVLGGKNVYYFLTPMEKGRLQTLPLAYDVRKQEWFDMAGSGMRHFPGRRPDEPVHWKDWPYTFNTACHSCHVSQLATNYDFKADSYHTVWLEPGINCETCHGPSEEHNRLFKGLAPGEKPADPKILSTKKFTPEQHNSSCSSCHAKASPITASYSPPERFFDHFDLATLENLDFYPDGRDLGENYTYTTWLMSPCAKNSKLNCLTCHTSSGRYRFKADEKANDACLPCHQEHVANSAAHTHHQPEGSGNKCIACHMPKTDFARMQRSDHSMRPPMPAANLQFHSPNACNTCHADQSAEWADQWVRQWRERDYQAPVLYRAGLVDAARKRDWTRLPEMLNTISDQNRDEVFANSLIRLLRASEDERIAPVLLAAMNDPSPLIRSSAAESLGMMPSIEGTQALVAATADDTRLVRIRAAQALAGLPGMQLQMGEPYASNVAKATEEYLAAITARPDQWSSHYNLGNFHLTKGDLPSAVTSYETAIRFDPTEVVPWVNLAMAYARKGDTAKAEESLGKALALEPDNAEANFNMGLLKAELNDLPQAESHLRRAFTTDPRMAPAAYNLCVILATGRPEEALGFCRSAAELRPRDPKYTWTYAYYQNQKGDAKGAAVTLEGFVQRQPGFAEGALLLADIYTRQGDRQKAAEAYNRALGSNDLNPRDRARIEQALNALKSQGPERAKQ